MSVRKAGHVIALQIFATLLPFAVVLDSYMH